MLKKASRSGWVDVSDAQNSIRDLSPIRKRKGDDDINPPRKRQRSSDLSPPRKPTKNDLSPPRKSTKSDSSPPRKPTKSDLSPRSDSSPLRKPTGSDSSPPSRSTGIDSSPPRKLPGSDSSPPRKATGSDSSPPRKPTGSGKAGLHTGEEIQKEFAHKKQQQLAEFRAMDPKLAGKDAPTIHRDKHGRPLRMLNKIINPTTEDEESSMEWGVGRVDKTAQEEEKNREEEEKGRGYHGVTINDPKLSEELLDRERFGDPMMGMLASDKKKKRNQKKVYQGHAPPNRFGIRPGANWDGVDRGLGYEARWFTARNEEKAKAAISLRWAQEDM